MKPSARMRNRQLIINIPERAESGKSTRRTRTGYGCPSELPGFLVFFLHFVDKLAVLRC
jgi:hypothetical protein